MSEFDILQAAASGMDAERAALDVAARNVAAAQATPERHGFSRLVPRYAFAPPGAGLPLPGAPEAEFDAGEPPAFPGGVAFDPADAAEDAAGDAADANLPVRYLGTRTVRGGDVDAVTEMVAVLDAQRAYDENAAVFDAGKRLAERTIDMGRLA